MDPIKMKSKIAFWHENDFHKHIIKMIEELPEEERGYELTCLLARAYNNRTRNNEKGIPNWEKAIALLESVREKGERDAMWHFRMGYALFHLGKTNEALEYFLASEKIVDYSKETKYFIDLCKQNQ